MASLGQIVFCSMITLIILFATAILLILTISVTGKTSNVLSNNKLPIANFGNDELLSCYIITNSEEDRFTGMSVTWTKTGLTGTVYHYEDGAPLLQNQNSQFKERTQLFPDNLLQGNASLLLRSVTPDDKGEYTCSISSSGGGGNVKVFLRTAAFTAPTFKFSNGILTAMARRWFPKPNVTWSDFYGNVLDGSTSFTEDFRGISSVVSTLQSANITDTYTFRIENELVAAVSRATVTTGPGVSETTYFIYGAASSLLASTYLSSMTSVVCIYYLT